MNPIDAEAHARDAALRFRILQLLNEARASASGIRGRKVQRWIDEADLADTFADDEHCLSLMSDLQSAGYIELHDQRTHAYEKFGLDKLDCKVTAKGTRFLACEEPADGLIADGRLKKKV